MKTRLLRKLQRKGESKINILSITYTNGISTGMSYGFDEDIYKGLFEIGDEEKDVKNKASRIYIKQYLNGNKSKVCNHF